MEGLALACLVALNTGFLPFSDFVTSEHLVASQVKWACLEGRKCWPCRLLHFGVAII